MDIGVWRAPAGFPRLVCPTQIKDYDKAKTIKRKHFQVGKWARKSEALWPQVRRLVTLYGSLQP